MAAGRDAARHAGSLYRKTFPFLRHSVQEIEAEAEHLQPLFLFFLIVAFAAYYIPR